MTAGQIIFSQIPRLPDDWWDHPSSVWTVWARNTWYLWGANAGNYAIVDPAAGLNGGGMASVAHGPTWGRGNPHYVGIITTSLDDAKNDAVFAALAAHLAGGDDIVVPTFHGKYALGTGYAVDWFPTRTDWWTSQRYIAAKIRDLIGHAAGVQMSAHDFWPDCLDARVDCHSRTLDASSPGVLPLTSPADLDAIIAHLDGAIPS